MTLPLRLDDTQREDDDYELYKQLTKDACYLFHELIAYNGMMGDLNYAVDYPRPYWNLINRVDTGDDDDRLIRSGILMLFLAMLHDEFDGSGISITPHRQAVSEALSKFAPEDSEMLRLCKIVERGLSLLESASPPDAQFATDSGWAFHTFVRGYFTNNVG